MWIFQNSWIIGIVTGIISGILVFFITKFFTNKKDRTVYYRKVKNANAEVIAALKPYIADKGLPEPEVFGSLIISTARAHNVQQEDMFSIENYCEELIREIISDVYVSNDKKQQYTSSLAEYRRENLRTKIKMELRQTISDIELSEMKSKYNKRLSLYLSMAVALFGGLATSLSLMSDDFDMVINTPSYLMLIPILILILVAMVLGLFIFSELILRKTRKRNDYHIINNKTDKK